MKPTRIMAGRILAGFLALAIMVLISRGNYLLFHSLVELFSVVILSSICLLVWNSVRFLDNGYLLFLGAAFPAVGVLNMVHLLAYRGMGVFDRHDANAATQLWIAQRALTSAAFLLAPLCLGRRGPARAALVLFSGAAALALGAIFYWDIFPACYIEGVGLTPFKGYSEIVIAAIFLLAIASVLRWRVHFDGGVLRLVVAAIGLAAATELCFILYTRPTDTANMIGHLVNVVSFALIYKAIVVTGITRPQNLLYRDLKLNEAALRASEQRYRTLVENAPLGILLLDLRDLRIKWSNHAFLKQLSDDQNPRQSLQGLALAEVLPPVDRAGILAILGQAAAAGRPHSVPEYPILGLARGGAYWQVMALPLAAPDQPVPDLMLLLMDVTEQTLARKHAEELVARLQQMNRSKDNFLAMLAHELRNPLAPILNAIYVLKLRDGAGENPCQYMEIIERQSQHMARLVDDLLDVSRITTGKIELRRERVDLVRIVQHAVESSQSIFKARGHELVVRLPEPPLILDADPARLEQVLVNLLNNAAKYTPAGGRVWLEAGCLEGEATLAVRDNGVGLTPELLTEIFEPFSQAERTLDRSEGGLGLGLTLVRSLVRMHGGTIEARSAGLGQGSEFLVYLPLARAEKEVEPQAAAPAQEPAVMEADAAVCPMRVLIVEDNADSAASLGELLTHWGHQPAIVRHGGQALSQALAFQPDVVLLDIGLPDMDGYHVARKLRSEPALRPLLIVAITGYGQREDLNRAGEAGFDHHLAKPINLRRLRELLVRHAETLSPHV